MEQRDPQNSGQRGRVHQDRVHGIDDRGPVNRLTRAIKKDWNKLHEFIVTPMGSSAYVVREKAFVGREKPHLTSLHEHENVVLFGINGQEHGRERLVGYALIFSGAPFTHYYTRYVGLSYSDPNDVKFRQMRVLYDDATVRLLRFGVGVFDYLWEVRHRVAAQHQAPVADHAAYVLYSKLWKEKKDPK